MRKNTSWVIICTIAITLCVISPQNLLGQENAAFSSLHFGIHSGYSMLQGYYADELMDGPYFSLSALSPFTRLIYGFFDIAFSSYELSGSNGSQLYSLSMNAGPYFRFSLISDFGIYACPFARVEYLYLKAQKLNREENTLKPGFGGQAGLYYAFSPALHASAGIDVAQVWLSGTPFRRVTFHAGIAYNIFHIPAEDKVRARRAEEKLTAYSRADALYAEGVQLFEKGDASAAKERFAETVRLKKNHAGATSYLEKISEIEKDYRLGMEHIEKKNFFAAIPLLERVEPSMKEAKIELEKTRLSLAPQISELSKRGVRAYEMSDYETCIDLMTKVKLIDPKNKTASIYLPRAKQRWEAMKKLK